jgi:hypothetical protein
VCKQHFAIAGNCNLKQDRKNNVRILIRGLCKR